MAVWRKGYCYQYTADGWIELDPKTNSDKYMVALADLLENAPDGHFNNSFILNLMAQKAFIEYLSAMDIELNQRFINGKLQSGSIRSNDYIKGLRGFKINFDGNSEFSNVVARGHVEAKSGIFDTVVGVNMSISGGSIQVGPLYVSDQLTTPSQTRTFPANTLVTTFVNTFIPENPPNDTTIYRTVPVNYGGTHGTRALYGVTVSKGLHPDVTESAPYVMSYNITFSTSNGSYYASGGSSIGYQVVINGGGAGKTIRITDLPTQPPSQSGSLWRKLPDNNLMVVPFILL
jgi:hypothetical protein